MPHCLPSHRRCPDLQHQQDLERLGEEITELAAHIHAATFQLLELIRIFDEEQGWGSDGVNSCAHWLNWKCGMNTGAAREKVRVSHALPHLPKISAAFREGRLSYSKVRAMTRVATRENEDYLLMIARHGTAAHVERLVSAYRGAERIKAMELENLRHAQRELSWFTDGDGMWVFKGRFTAEQGALISKALEAAMDEMFHESAEVPADVSAETRAWYFDSIGKTASISTQKPFHPTGPASGWTSTWRFAGCRTVNEPGIQALDSIRLPLSPQVGSNLAIFFCTAIIEWQTVQW
jgi:hypothetical protein